ncbi:MAG: MerR family transcriptional regulator [Flavobacteriales bacterium]|nr:MerR family transcriptional regulator [Flavobacteriales bacterium]
MTVYSIKDLELISGIKAHTIRIWEQRYGLFTPQRTETNIRYYDSDQLCKLLNISNLIANGYKVSQIAKLSKPDMQNKVNELIDSNELTDTKAGILINRLIDSAINYDEELFQELFYKSVDTYGLIGAFTHVIYPMLIRIGLMWFKQDIIPAQEHFISNLIRQKLFVAINSLEQASNNAESWLLFLPEDEEHEIGLLLSYFILKSKGKRVFYLGQRVPISSLDSIIHKKQPDAIHFFLVKNNCCKKTQEYIDQISEISKGIKVHVSGNEILKSQVKMPRIFNWINSLEKFTSKI